MQNHMRDRKPAPPRHCGSCTACCDGWLKITINGETVEPGKKCPFSSGHNCIAYDQRPIDPCRQFVCGWLADQSPLPEWLRPDQANVIVLASHFWWRDLPVDVAVPVATGIKKKAFTWLQDFAVGQKRLLVYQAGENWFAFGPTEFQQDMYDRVQRGEALW